MAASPPPLSAPPEPGISLFGEPLPEFDAPLRNPIVGTPPRRDDSIRRTMTIDVAWPGGAEAPAVLSGCGRDLVTRSGQAPPSPVAEAQMRALLQERQVVDIALVPALAGIDALRGVNAGGELRKAFAALAPQERAAGSLAHLLIDDTAGASLVSRWTPNFWRDRQRQSGNQPSDNPVMAGLCIGFRPGSAALFPDGRRKPAQAPCTVGRLDDPRDPHGWHRVPEASGMHFRRARRIDVWKDAEGFTVDAFFQDSASNPAGGARVGIHEYGIEARIDAAGILRSVTVNPGVLPFASCRAAPVNVAVLIGMPIAAMREGVAAHLKGTAGCTHLNDVMRSLADVPALAAKLP